VVVPRTALSDAESFMYYIQLVRTQLVLALAFTELMFNSVLTVVVMTSPRDRVLRKKSAEGHP
jgi:hypothetical protein